MGIDPAGTKDAATGVHRSDPSKGPGAADVDDLTMAYGQVGAVEFAFDIDISTEKDDWRHGMGKGLIHGASSWISIAPNTRGMGCHGKGFERVVVVSKIQRGGRWSVCA